MTQPLKPGSLAGEEIMDATARFLAPKGGKAQVAPARQEKPQRSAPPAREEKPRRDKTVQKGGQERNPLPRKDRTAPSPKPQPKKEKPAPKK